MSVKPPRWWGWKLCLDHCWITMGLAFHLSSSRLNRLSVCLSCLFWLCIPPVVYGRHTVPMLSPSGPVFREKNLFPHFFWKKKWTLTTDVSPWQLRVYASRVGLSSLGFSLSSHRTPTLIYRFSLWISLYGFIINKTDILKLNRKDVRRFHGGLKHLKWKWIVLITDEVNRREVFECDGWVCDLEVIGNPSIFKLIGKPEVLVRTERRVDLWKQLVFPRNEILLQVFKVNSFRTTEYRLKYRLCWETHGPEDHMKK